MISPSQIHVQRTFDLEELDQLPVEPGRVKIRPTGLDREREEYYERSSQEDLVKRSSD